MENIGITEILLLLGSLISLGISFYCAKKAEKLNRSRFGWALFGFCLPIIAIIVIHYMKPLQK